MELKDYSTEELKAELKRRSDLAKAEKVKQKDVECANTGEELLIAVTPITKQFLA